jgi:general secretion pathway protein A
MEASASHRAHFGLIAEPFGEISDPRFIWLDQRRLEAIANLKVGVEQTKGILLLTGEEGSGRSVLVACLLKAVSGGLQSAVLREPEIDAARFLDWLGGAFGLSLPGAGKGELLLALKESLKAARARGVNVLLIVDAAERQGGEVLEQIRLLSNMEEGGQKLLSILLVGTGALSEAISAPQHRALLQRVAVRCQLAPLTEPETAAYIRHRMMVAGAFLPVFEDGAVRVIHRLSGGLPGTIGLVCEHLLARAAREGRHRVDEKSARGYAKAMRGVFEAGRSGRSAVPPEEGGAAEAAGARGGRSAARIAAALTALACLLLAAGIVHETRREIFRPASDTLPPPLSLRFGPGPEEVPPEAAAGLSRIAADMQRRPRLIAAIHGYCGSGTPDDQCYTLSRARAEAVRSRLSDRGLDPERLIALGRGPEPGAASGSFRVDIEFSTRQSR